MAENTPKVIKLIENYPCLWDKSSRSYADAVARKAAMLVIAEKTGLSSGWLLVFCN